MQIPWDFVGRCHVIYEQSHFYSFLESLCLLLLFLIALIKTSVYSVD